MAVRTITTITIKNFNKKIFRLIEKKKTKKKNYYYYCEYILIFCVVCAICFMEKNSLRFST